MLYTRKGDSGTSGLFGTKKRFQKNSPVYDGLGALDELNSLLGVCLAVAERSGFEMPFHIPLLVRTAQQHLFIAQAELAGADKHITQTMVEEVENMIELLEKHIQNPHSFVISGATELSALLDYARAVCRRTERVVIKACTMHKVSAATKIYLNRLSSLLYVLARYTAAAAGAKESSPAYY